MTYSVDFLKVVSFCKYDCKARWVLEQGASNRPETLFLRTKSFLFGQAAVLSCTYLYMYVHEKHSSAIELVCERYGAVSFGVSRFWEPPLKQPPYAVQISLLDLPFRHTKLDSVRADFSCSKNIQPYKISTT